MPLFSSLLSPYLSLSLYASISTSLILYSLFSEVAIITTSSKLNISVFNLNKLYPSPVKSVSIGSISNKVLLSSISIGNYSSVFNVASSKSLSSKSFILVTLNLIFEFFDMSYSHSNPIYAIYSKLAEGVIIIFSP